MRRTIAALALTAVTLLTACGSASDDTDAVASSAERGPDGLTGFRRNPAPPSHLRV